MIKGVPIPAESPAISPTYIGAPLALVAPVLEAGDDDAVRDAEGRVILVPLGKGVCTLFTTWFLTPGPDMVDSTFGHVVIFEPVVCTAFVEYPHWPVLQKKDHGRRLGEAAACRGERSSAMASTRSSVES